MPVLFFLSINSLYLVILPGTTKLLSRMSPPGLVPKVVCWHVSCVYLIDKRWTCWHCMYLIYVFFKKIKVKVKQWKCMYNQSHLSKFKGLNAAQKGITSRLQTITLAWISIEILSQLFWCVLCVRELDLGVTCHAYVETTGYVSCRNRFSHHQTSVGRDLLSPFYNFACYQLSSIQTLIPSGFGFFHILPSLPRIQNKIKKYSDPKSF